MFNTAATLKYNNDEFNAWQSDQAAIENKSTMKIFVPKPYILKTVGQHRDNLRCKL